MLYYVDGFTVRGNPSPKGGGYAVMTEHGKLVARELFKRHFTNNEGEILGLLAACEMAEYGDSIATDSENSLKWVKSRGSKARPDLNEVIQRCATLQFEKALNIYHVPRERNKAGLHLEGKL